VSRRAREVARKWITENCICYTDDADLERDVLELERLIDAEVANLVGAVEFMDAHVISMVGGKGPWRERRKSALDGWESEQGGDGG